MSIWLLLTPWNAHLHEARYHTCKNNALAHTTTVSFSAQDKLCSCCTCMTRMATQDPRSSSIIPPPPAPPHHGLTIAPLTHVCVRFAACCVDPELKALCCAPQEVPHPWPQLGPHAHAHQAVKVLLVTRARQLCGRGGGQDDGRGGQGGLAWRRGWWAKGGGGRMGTGAGYIDHEVIYMQCAGHKHQEGCSAAQGRDESEGGQGAEGEPTRQSDDDVGPGGRHRTLCCAM